MDWFGSKKREEREKIRDKKFNDDVIRLYDEIYLKYEDKVDRPTFNRICTDSLRVSSKVIRGRL